MRIERIEKSKHKQERVLVFLEGGDLLRITGVELLRFGLHKDMELPEELVEELRHLNEQLGIPATLSEVGVTADKIPAMAEDAMKSGNIPANPRQSTVKDIIKLYEKTM